MIRALRGFARLSRADRATTLRVFALALAVDAGVRTVPFPTLLRWLGLSLTKGPPGEPLPNDPVLERLVKHVDRVLRRWPEEGRCLRRSLVLGVLLREHAPVVKLGVAKDAAGVRAHAWVEIDDQPIGESSDPTAHFAPLSAP